MTGLPRRTWVQSPPQAPPNPNSNPTPTPNPTPNPTHFRTGRRGVGSWCQLGLPVASTSELVGVAGGPGVSWAYQLGV